MAEDFARDSQAASPSDFTKTLPGNRSADATYLVVHVPYSLSHPKEGKSLGLPTVTSVSATRTIAFLPAPPPDGVGIKRKPVQNVLSCPTRTRFLEFNRILSRGNHVYFCYVLGVRKQSDLFEN